MEKRGSATAHIAIATVAGRCRRRCLASPVALLTVGKEDNRRRRHNACCRHWEEEDPVGPVPGLGLVQVRSDLTHSRSPAVLGSVSRPSSSPGQV